MTQNSSSSVGAVAALTAAVGSIITTLFPGIAIRHHRALGTAEGEKDVAKSIVIQNALESKTIAAPPDCSPEQLMSALNSSLYITVKKELNREDVFTRFGELLEEGERERLTPIREEIALPIYEYAGECTTKEAQERWAKLIAGECRNPGSISLRTVRILNSMSTEDAEILESFACITVERVLFLQEAQGYDLEKIVHLSSLGIIISGTVSAFSHIPPNGRYNFTRNNKTGWLENTSSETIKMNGYGLTKSGIEIMRLSTTIPDADQITKNMKIPLNTLRCIF